MPTLLRTRTVYSGWCKVQVADFRDANGCEFSREIVDHGSAVAVLPYGPENRTAVLVRLMRAPVFVAERRVDLLEAPAGMIEDETPAESIRREAMEEIGLRLRDLEHVGRTWSSPGLSTETIDLYLAPYSPADQVVQGGGLAAENEGITIVELPLNELHDMARRGDIADLKTLCLVLALKDRHPELFEG